MNPSDARRLSPSALDALRERAVAAVQGGASCTEAARLFGVRRQTVSGWVNDYRRHGAASLKSRRQAAASRTWPEPTASARACSPLLTG